MLEDKGAKAEAGSEVIKTKKISKSKVGDADDEIIRKKQEEETKVLLDQGGEISVLDSQRIPLNSEEIGK